MKSIDVELFFQSYPDNIFIEKSNQKLTYRLCFTLIKVLSSNLKKFKQGQLIAVYDLPVFETILLSFAAWLNQQIIFPLDKSLPKKTLKKYIEQTGCQILVSQKSFSSAGILVLSFQDLLRHTAASSNIKMLSVKQNATLIATSGSSGESKFALLSIGNHYYSAKAIIKKLSVTQNSNWLLALPLFHVSGLSILWRCLLSGSTIKISTFKKSIAKKIKETQPTHTSLVPYQLNELIKDNSTFPVLKNMRAILLGGSAFNTDDLKSAYFLKLPIYISYGFTEMASTISCSRLSMNNMHTSGKTLPYRKLKIYNNEIFTKGSCLFSGYLKKGSLSAAIDQEGWFASGDVGYLNESGELIVNGRKDNMFISGGENIQPEEIEKILKSVPEIEDAIVVPVNDERFGKRPAAYIKSSISINTEKLKKYLGIYMPKYKIPDFYLPWPNENIQIGIKTDRAYLKKHVTEAIKSQ